MSENNPPEKCLVCGETKFIKQGKDNVKGHGYYQRWKCCKEGCGTTVRGEKI